LYLSPKAARHPADCLRILLNRSYGKKKETIAVIVPYDKWEKSPKRELGTLKHRAKVTFSKDFSMTTEEFINSLDILLIPIMQEAYQFDLYFKQYRDE
jgi:hypothetical protein